MSLFLGKVHYWMYDKIKWFENIEREIKDFIDEKGLPLGEWEEEVLGKFMEPCQGAPLEEVIDQSNIHGWLSERVENAEGRLSVYLTKVLNEKESYIDELETLFYERGKIQGDAKGKTIDVASPSDIFNAMNDFILEGMPCDNALQVIDEDDNKIAWTLTVDLHKKFYDAVGGDVRNFYKLRDAWKRGFTQTIANGYKYVRVDLNKEEIIKEGDN